MLIKNKISEKLYASLRIEHLNVIDESHKHEGHAGHDGSGESHFKIVIVSKEFEGLSRIKIHRLIFKILDEEMKNQIHALAIDAKTTLA